MKWLAAVYCSNARIISERLMTLGGKINKYIYMYSNLIV